MSEEFTPLTREELLSDITATSNIIPEPKRKNKAETAEISADGTVSPKKPASGQKKPKAEPIAHTAAKHRATHARSGRSKQENVAPRQSSRKKDTDVKTDEQAKITLSPVASSTGVTPIIDLPPRTAETTPQTLVIDLPAAEQAPTAPTELTDVQLARWRRKREVPVAIAEEKRPASAIFFCALRRFLLAVFLISGLLVAGLWLVLDLIFSGPSPTARDVLTMSLSEASGTKWVPGLFLDDQLVEEIRRGDTTLLAEDEKPSDLPPIEINTDTSLTANSDEWKDCPDGIRIEHVSGDTYNAYVMLVRDPSKVYLATASKHFSKEIPGRRITEQIEREGAIAAVNAGAFFDNGTSDPSVGSIPQGLTISQGKVVWEEGNAPEQGFMGFNQDNVLIVADTMTAEEARALGIRDGCCFGPVLIQNGAIKNDAYNSASGYNPRTAIGQRADGSVILLCIDGRQSQSIGGTYADIIDIMVEYGAVNACNLDGGSSTTMLYRDQTGRYGTAGQVHMINNYSLLQSQPRRMPTFIMVRPEGEE